jgi:hypothetical protein
MAKTIVLTAEPDGSFTIEAHGYSDGECVKATKELEDELGIVVKRISKNQVAAKAKQGNKLNAGR